MVGPYVESCTVVVASGEFDVLEVARGAPPSWAEPPSTAEDLGHFGEVWGRLGEVGGGLGVLRGAWGDFETKSARINKKGEKNPKPLGF